MVTPYLCNVWQLMRRGIEIDPYSPNLLADLRQLHYFAREYDEAERHCRKALDVHPDFILAFGHLSEIYWKVGKFEESLDFYLKAHAVEVSFYFPHHKLSAKELVQQYGSVRGFLQKKLKDHEKLGESCNCSMSKAFLLMLLGNREAAVKLLEGAYREHAFVLPFVGIDPRYDDLRGEPGFREVLRKIGLTRIL